MGGFGLTTPHCNKRQQDRRQKMKQAKTVDKHVRARRADNRDAEVGRRVRSRRLECRLSQTELADRIGVTFQQVQKYEKGVNRIGAGRLQRISEALEVPISFFFGAGTTSAKPETNSSAESVFGFLQTSGSVRIVKAFHKIKSRKAKQLLVEMAEELADAQAA
jgi:transcriptional regulator with XRE-family HTH domain